jgi:hypothetical protein
MPIQQLREVLAKAVQSVPFYRELLRASILDVTRDIDPAAPRAEVVAQYQGTWLVRAAGAGLQMHFPSRGVVSDHIYLIDSLGNLMMRFPRDPDPQRMVKDLARLLKASRIG